MKFIKRWDKFSESISGWELIGNNMGPGYPKQQLYVPLSTSDTQVLYGVDGKLYTWDDFRDLWNEYVKLGGKENLSDFTKQNLDKVITLLSENS